MENRNDLVLRKTAAGQGRMSPFGESCATRSAFEKSNGVGFAKGLMDAKVVLSPLAMFSTGGVDAAEFA